jgi:hypothetical protein
MTPSSDAAERFSAPGDWTVAVPASLERIDNGDSWQAHRDGFVVYVSALALNDKGGGKTPAKMVCEIARQKLAPPGAQPAMTFAEQNVLGEAAIKTGKLGWQLKGFACADGSIAVCVIDYASEEDRTLAVSTWQSLRHP